MFSHSQVFTFTGIHIHRYSLSQLFKQWLTVPPIRLIGAVSIAKNILIQKTISIYTYPKPIQKKRNVMSGSVSIATKILKQQTISIDTEPEVIAVRKLILEEKI